MLSRIAVCFVQLQFGLWSSSSVVVHEDSYLEIPANLFFSRPFFKDLTLEIEVEIEEGEEKEITEEGGYHSSRRGTT